LNIKNYNIDNDYGNKIPAKKHRRRCKYPGCKTWLNAYNPNQACSIHIIKYAEMIDKKIECLRRKLIKTKDKSKKSIIKKKLEKLRNCL